MNKGSATPIIILIILVLGIVGVSAYAYYSLDSISGGDANIVQLVSPSPLPTTLDQYTSKEIESELSVITEGSLDQDLEELDLSATGL